jgi:hypothetical protein
MPVGPQALLLGSVESVCKSLSSVIGEEREEYHSNLICGSGRYSCCQKLLNRVWSIGLAAVQL